MNLDRLKLFPNQLTDFDPTECTSLTVTDMAANIIGIPFSNDFTYAATFDLLGQQPSTAGTDPRAAMFTAPMVGLLPAEYETFTSKTVGELYAANFSNYSYAQKKIAFQHRICADLVPCNYDDVVKTLKNGQSVSLAMKWYWGVTPSDVLVMPSNSNAPYSLHNVPVYDFEDPRGLTLKPLLGPNVGDNGYCFLPQETFTKCAFWTMKFVPQANPTLQSISLKIVYYPYFNSLFV